MFAVPSLPPVINQEKKDKLEEKYKDVPIEDVKAPQPNHKIVILHTKEITFEDLEKIRRHGKVIRFSKALLNTDIKKVDADYILCDANESDILSSLEKHFNNDQDNLDFCVYCRFYEKSHFDKLNCFCTFKDAANKEDFDFLLLNKKNFKKVNSLFACMSFVVNFLVNLKK